MSRHTIWSKQKIGKLVQPARKPVEVCAERTYREIGIRSHGRGIFYKNEVLGLDLGSKRVFWVEPGCFVVNIVFAWEQAVAKTTDAEKGMIASHRFPMYRPLDDKVDLDYLLYFFKTPHGKYLLELASPGGAGRNKTLGQEAFLELAIPVPPLEEQQRIAEILSTWDEAIRLTQELIVAKQQRKKGLMQRLLMGQVRFKEFGERLETQESTIGELPADWQIVRLAELGVFLRGSGIAKSQVVEEGLPCIRYGEIYTTHHFQIQNFHSFIDSETAERSTPIYAGDLLFAGSGETLEEIGKCVAYTGDEIAYAGGDIIILRLSKGDTQFLGYLLNHDITNRQKFKLGQGHSVVHIYPSQLETILVTFPSIEEQRHIATILQACDHEIQLLQQKLAALQQQKKGLMQRLLTGQVRVQLDNNLEARTPLPKLTMIENFSTHCGDWYFQKNKKYPTRIAAQKMPYLFQVSTGLSLGLEYERHYMGPYSLKLHRLLEEMNGVYLTGYGDGSEAAEIKPTAEAIHAANDYFQNHPELEAAFTRFANFVQGFETAFRLELLATVHWLMQEIPNASFEQIVQGVHEWNSRKRNRYKSETLIRKAWEHLRQFEVAA